MTIFVPMLILFFMAFAFLLIMVVLKGLKASAKIEYVCPNCKTISKKSELKLYNYKYSYEYRCTKCGYAVIER